VKPSSSTGVRRSPAPTTGASAQDRQGLVLRRRFGFRDGALTAYEDDRLSGPAAVSALLLQEIERPRSGPMRDIVATVQPEQDVLVRAPLEQTVCVQGAPGTGKTAVGLHRAAYLLYAHRAQLAATGVLVVGPNRAFLSYVQEVLPALGEVQVTSLTVDELAPAVRLRREAGAAEAQVKGDARTATVLERALWLHAVRVDEPLVLAVGVRRMRLQPEDVREVERAVRGRGLAWNASRSAFAGALARRLVRLQDEAGISTSERAVERLSRNRVVTGYVDRRWPPLTAAGLVRAVLTDRDLLARAADGVLTAAEQDALAAGPPGRWSRADLPLLDEAAGLLERPAGYAHVVVDEAQDLSAMQLRAVGGAAPRADATVLGDLAQGTTASAPGDWSEVLRHLGKPSGAARRAHDGLYRVPRESSTWPNRLLPVIAPGIAPADSLRSVPARSRCAAPAARRRRGGTRSCSGGDRVESPCRRRRGAAAGGRRRPRRPRRGGGTCSDRRITGPGTLGAVSAREGARVRRGRAARAGGDRRRSGPARPCGRSTSRCTRAVSSLLVLQRGELRPKLDGTAQAVLTTR
jgi:hypothetical protein